MRIFPVVLSLLLIAAPFAAEAQRAPVVLELYTSQGCAACPPADALLPELGAREGVIALALHVDYWDYLGWADSFAKPAHTARQHAYKKRFRKRSVFTPQMIIQGETLLVGHDAKAIVARIAALQAQPATISLRVSRETGALRIRLAPVDAGVGGSDVYVVEFEPDATVEIVAGENAGHKYRYSNIVTAWNNVGAWDGETEADMRVDWPGTEPVAVIVQKTHLGPILSAAKLP